MNKLSTYTESSITSVAKKLQASNDFLAELQQKAKTTQRGYAGNIRIFFEYFLQREPNQKDVEEFWGLDDQTANGLILKFKNHLVAEGRKAATINRYLSALKYLIRWDGTSSTADITLIAIALSQ
ncbi:hypothetical protein ANSO36C_68280 (plasmid) [Nostoc cf. commune SO-36]|uniref:Core-binding (CB) domain-containing protein n=1 Tax=Nostoc cf. commune SO-36 TaxID=449208 RepID=A0ABM7ZCI8_NOSCO|nr:site-specific integrase [Nostoc commune]BDI21026.1 hypothetical protein ANSO36C_68280 [Nostoc cf. commune SO-36]